ncbi:unnamed protein product [Periconia digitata]|uniref:Uncharacterized protein n=1 Tax=Periconia digitata TaxID=1303443 RepID=A0A9W4UN84_9PLEO|nr:unnamed protein product [Periconia digitata]
MPKGVVSMAELEALIYRTTAGPKLVDLVKDARRFIMYHNRSIEEAPLQAYVSALVFSPTSSFIRKLFDKEAPPWVSIKPSMTENWSACLQTLEGHSGPVYSLAWWPSLTTRRGWHRRRTTRPLRSGTQRAAPVCRRLKATAVRLARWPSLTTRRGWRRRRLTTPLRSGTQRAAPVYRHLRATAIGSGWWSSLTT